MAVTEAEPHVEGHATADAEAESRTGIAALLGTADHLALGRMFVVASLLFLVIGRVAGILVAAERIDTGSVSILDEYLGQVFSLHLLADLFLFLIPAFVGIAVAVIPLQIGAATVAFPRAVAAALWTWLLSSGVLLASYLTDGGFPDYVEIQKRDASLLSVVGLGGVLAALLVAIVCVLTTVLAARTAGMSVDRVPMFTWGMFVAGLVWLSTLPIAGAVVALTYVDVRYGSGIGAANRLGWVFGAPQVFAFAAPTLGLALDVVPVAAGTRLRHRGVLLGAVAVAGILTFGADTLVGNTEPSIYTDVLYVAGAFAALLPLLAILGGIADTLRRGKPTVSSPLLFALFGLLTLLAGVVVNAIRVIDGFDLTGTAADSAVAELAIVGGLLGVAGAAHHWATKLLGNPLKEGIGRLAALVLFLGALVVAVPDLVSGFLDQPYGAGALPFVEDGVEALNGVSLAGGLLVLLGLMLVLLNLAVGRGSDGEAPADPWNGHTLEWATASPPAPGGPGPLEPVTSATPLLDQKEANA